MKWFQDARMFFYDCMNWLLQPSLADEQTLGINNSYYLARLTEEMLTRFKRRWSRIYGRVRLSST